MDKLTSSSMMIFVELSTAEMNDFQSMILEFRDFLPLLEKNPTIYWQNPQDLKKWLLLLAGYKNTKG